MHHILPLNVKKNSYRQNKEYYILPKQNLFVSLSGLCISPPMKFHVEVFWINASDCKSSHNGVLPKLNGTKKCNCNKGALGMIETRNWG